MQGMAIRGLFGCEGAGGAGKPFDRRVHVLLPPADFNAQQNAFRFWEEHLSMRSFLANEIKSVAGEGGDHLSGCKRTDAAVIDAHALDGDGDTGLLLGNLFDHH
jgi:hypothetical protein